MVSVTRANCVTYGRPHSVRGGSHCDVKGSNSMKGSKRKQLQQACDLFVGFREKQPTKVKVVQVSIPAALMVVGHVDGIDYTTTHGRKSVAYRHEFAPGSRPLLCASPDGKQMFLLGGRFQFGERGIVDLDRHGREVKNTKHGTELDSDD